MSKYAWAVLFLIIALWNAATALDVFFFEVNPTGWDYFWGSTAAVVAAYTGYVAWDLADE